MLDQLAPSPAVKVTPLKSTGCVSVGFAMGSSDFAGVAARGGSLAALTMSGGVGRRGDPVAGDGGLGVATTENDTEAVGGRCGTLSATETSHTKAAACAPKLENHAPQGNSEPLYRIDLLQLGCAQNVSFGLLHGIGLHVDSETRNPLQP